MISPEILRRYPFFALISDEQLRNLAMAGQEQICEPGEVLFEQNDPATILYFLLEGCINLYYTVEDAYWPEQRKEIAVCEICPGEPFSISALIPPYILTSTARSCPQSRVIAFDAQTLQQLLRDDPALEVIMLRRVAQAALERLSDTRIQLAAAWA